jgi:hypothetical protein
LDEPEVQQIIDEQSDGPKRWIGRFLMENLLATARSSRPFVAQPYQYHDGSMA